MINWVRVQSTTGNAEFWKFEVKKGKHFHQILLPFHQYYLSWSVELECVPLHRIMRETCTLDNLKNDCNHVWLRLIISQELIVCDRNDAFRLSIKWLSLSLSLSFSVAICCIGGNQWQFSTRLTHWWSNSMNERNRWSNRHTTSPFSVLLLMQVCFKMSEKPCHVK